jgi:hypothetical protein
VISNLGILRFELGKYETPKRTIPWSTIQIISESQVLGEHSNLIGIVVNGKLRHYISTGSPLQKTTWMGKLNEMLS